MEPARTHRARSVVEAARLHRAKDRRERGLTLVEGPELLVDVASAGARVVEVFSTHGSEGDVPEGAALPTMVDQRALRRLAGTKTPRGPVAVVEIPSERLDAGRDLLVSIGVSDPGNVGTLIRTAASFGWGYAYTAGSADPWSPKTIRAGAGGQFQTPVAGISGLADLGPWVTVATVVRGGDALGNVQGGPVALLVGEEAHGLDPAIAGNCDHEVSIPTPGQTESLNVAVAAGIAVYELWRRSGERGTGV